MMASVKIRAEQRAGALLKQVQLPDGTKMENGGPAGPPKISIETGEPLE